MGHFGNDLSSKSLEWNNNPTATKHQRQTFQTTVIKMLNGNWVYLTRSGQKLAESKPGWM